MLQFNRWQIGSVIALIVLGVYFSLPNFFAEDERPGFLPETTVTLGLDLQGGTYLLLGVDTDGVLVDRITSIQSDVAGRLRNAPGGRIRFGRISVDRENLSLSVPITDPADVDRAMDSLRRLSGTLGGGVAGIAGAGRELRISRGEGTVILVALTDEAQSFYADEAVSDSIEVIRRRIDSLGTTEPSIQRQGADRLVVQVPGNSDSEGIRRVLDAQGQLSFHMVDGTADPTAPTPPRRLTLPLAEFPGQSIVIFENPDVTGDMVTSASASPNADGPGFQVNFGFDNRGARRFGNVTRENIGRQFAIVLDDTVISAPRIQSAITGGSGRITGSFSPEEAQELAVLIRSGALPAELTTIEQRTVGADLGADSVRAGTIALILGFIGVVIFIVLVYLRMGIYADIALFANVLLMAGALSLLGATLTLPGIAGIVLTIGMAVDANVLIFERIKEEISSGKGAVAAVEAGYRNAWSAIFDANLTTLIAAFLMFMLGAGPVRGFAVTLGIGVVTSVFTAFVLTRLFIGAHVLGQRRRKGKASSTRFGGGLKLIPDDTHIHFASMRNIAAILSAVAIVVSIGAVMTKGLNFGVDFRGGVTVEVGPAEGQTFANEDLTQVRAAVGTLDLGDVQAKTIGGVAGAPDGIAVTVPLQDAETGGEIDPEAEARQVEVANQLRQTLTEVLGAEISFRRTDIVGPTVSGELIQRGAGALLLAIGLMLVYIWFRFEWQFSLGAIIALVHDVILTIGIFSITQFDFTLSVIAALLTIIGYSMNDTVVVFDRIRENLRKFKSKPLTEVVDLSINQTLSRTIMTSVTTLVALVSLFLFGGEVLRGFSFALIWGILVGTYSSVFIASPTLLRTGVKRDWSANAAAEAPSAPPATT
ncbi:hypothetical protein PB2503_10364 [Parvularcula bermudensis HTCC2503]|uniref:Multifunctional fusion protein n=1 Tax=Parvularcula bermudensis (strain ATCC BAA-594 / HTCC2503 / KCTC 12087) TaxID=314260 RepID=E0TG05_PARBH|nr:protein translocase subunit SecD [Parvularcula bermudensis]ADM10124.1 hypothetical protein PB2503_10364 [Parvularcula bermudensis HTCC2503]